MSGSFGLGSRQHATGPRLGSLPGGEAARRETWREPGVKHQAGGQAPGAGRARVTLRRVTCGGGGHGGKRAPQRRGLPSAAPQRLEPAGGRHPQRLEELLAVGGQGEGSAEGLRRGGGRGGQYPDAAAGEWRPPAAEDRGAGAERAPGSGDPWGSRRTRVWACLVLQPFRAMSSPGSNS